MSIFFTYKWGCVIKNRADQTISRMKNSSFYCENTYILYVQEGVIMESKLTLKLDSTAIKRAKQYIMRHKGNSLSKLVEQYFNSLTSAETVREKKLPPIVSSLSGVLKDHGNIDAKKEYTGYLMEKYK